MSFSGHSPPSTQAILSAQRTPSLASRRTVHRKRSIIIISSSPDLSIRSQSIQVLDSEDEQYFGPQRTAASPQSNPTRHRKSQNENSIEVVEDEEFTKLLAGFKYASSSSSAASCSVPRAPLATRKTNLDSYFQEVKPSSKAKRAGAKTTRLKPSLATRVNPLAKPPIPREKPEKQAVQTAHTSFFTSWAADQAPVIRPPKPSAKPRRKPVKKKDVDVVLLSPRTGQESVRRPPEDESVRKLGERSNGGMWDACKRGLEGELYDVDGEIVFSQELRDIQVEEVEIVGTGEGGESTEGGKQILCLQEEPPAQRKVKVVQVRDDGMPAYSSFTTQQLQKEVKKFGFKASKDRSAMTALLEECWKATQQVTQEPTVPAIPLVTIAVEDASSPDLLTRLHNRITQTVKDDLDQSVYLGILRFEPVVVEDLVEWLTARDLVVPELVVRGWCDKEGVCCVNRGTLPGRHRSRR